MNMDVSILPVKRQASIKTKTECSGVGLHNGKRVKIIMHPAPVNSGIKFVRTDIDGIDNVVEVRADALVDAKRCTIIANNAGVEVSTIEHLMAALSASGIDNMVIEIDGEELPALDGSSEPYLGLFEQAGIEIQNAPRRYIKVLKKVEVSDGNSCASISPFPCLYLDVMIDFAESAIGTQRIEIEPDVKAFRERLASARTFARAHEVVALREAGLGLGGSYDNAVVVDGEKVLNPNGLRYNDEFVRHKALDLLGDMYIGGPLLGKIVTERASHSLNHKLLLALFADKNAWRFSHQLHKEPNANRARKLQDLKQGLETGQLAL